MSTVSNIHSSGEGFLIGKKYFPVTSNILERVNNKVLSDT